MFIICAQVICLLVPSFSQIDYNTLSSCLLSLFILPAALFVFKLESQTSVKDEAQAPEREKEDKQQELKNKVMERVQEAIIVLTDGRISFMN